MIKVSCDRCNSEMNPRGLIGYLSWNFKEGVDGDLGANDLEGNHYCERCMDEIRAMINFPVKWEPEIIEETPKTAGKSRSSVQKGRNCTKKAGQKSSISKEKGEAILELKARGFKIKEIAEELEMDPVQVKNWLHYHKEKERCIV